jgi:hypothetical protein
VRWQKLTGMPAVEHAADYTLVTNTHPLMPGETVIIYATGFGAYTSGQTGVPPTSAEPLVEPPPLTVSLGGTNCVCCTLDRRPTMSVCTKSTAARANRLRAGHSPCRLFTPCKCLNPASQRSSPITISLVYPQSDAFFFRLKLSAESSSALRLNCAKAATLVVFPSLVATYR